MNDDDTMKDDGLDSDLPAEEDELGNPKKKLLDDEVESLDDAADEELEIDKDDLMDDVEEM